MPDALARKYPKGGTNWGWHWVFPADHCSRDPRSGTERRQHDDHMAIGELDQPVHVLVDHQDGLAGLAKLPQATPDLLADQRGEALGRFVQDQQPGVGHQRAPDREHLLLAARQLVAA
jgi:hypothetical protein